MFGRWSRMTPTAAIDAKTTIGHGSPSTNRQDRQRERGHDRGQRRVAGDEEGDDPDRDPDQAQERSCAEKHAAPGGHRLPALLEAEEERPPVAEHRGAAGEHGCQLADEERAHERRHEALRHVEHYDRDPEPASVGPPYVRRTDVAAAHLADVLALDEQDDPVPERHRPQQVAAKDDEGRSHRGVLQELLRHFSGIWYFETQSFTTAQSRLLKKTSM